MNMLRPGLALTALVGALAALVWGVAAVPSAVLFGLLATSIQVAAARIVLRASDERFGVFAQRWAVGMLLRLAGVALIPLALLAAPTLFAPLPVATGFLGVLLPLLYWETRLV